MSATTILVVDDEPDFELLVTQRFRRSIRGGELVFHFARDGEEALELLSRVPGIDLVLTDINMPRMDGLTLLLRLPEVDPQLRAVIVSAYGDMANIRTGMNRGAFDFVTKPVDFDDLTVTLNRAVEHVRAARAALQARDALLAMQEELAVAQRMQLAILPQPLPDTPGRQLRGFMQAAREVGGDFYDFFILPDGRLGLVIADVSGKGMSAALFMAVTRTLLRMVALSGVDAAQCLSTVNALLAADNPEMMFVTAHYATLDPATGSLEYASAGHPPPLLMGAEGAVRELPGCDGIVLGVRPAQEYPLRRQTLAPDEVLFLYTDGVTEAVDPAGNLFGEERLAATLASHRGLDCQDLLAAVVSEAVTFASSAPQADDITCLALRYRSGGR
ncbi:PP2C family protein-serine/threonine phosphatase [Neoroseomonas oryzicola]|uniref:SpoIIE family protein phosphatase n=1 Tax=Neoroseomonas oryzicola TaxID=535904 RepID=A0A9X9WEB5_9PROT|nr:SpoIIE family protein phosphatase [Neoroseomonas oryzicola]MBR0658675.1 SpoIIE family protein phosphatase [Neoroseomonas oryzicola]NKE17889.1 SpoIIE family protein phosphatase [Neoroseomonas oryzicola]